MYWVGRFFVILGPSSAGKHESTGLILYICLDKVRFIATGILIVFTSEKVIERPGNTTTAAKCTAL